MIRELDTVVMARDVPEHKLRAGDIGAVVHVHRDGAAYEVEFVTRGGENLVPVTLPAEAVRTIMGYEIAHARVVA
jgi:hypothetical protein